MRKKYWLLRLEVRRAGQCKAGSEETLKRLMRWKKNNEERGTGREPKKQRVRGGS